MSYYLSPIGNTQIIDANGDPLVGGTISTFLAGTSTTATTYTDDTGGTAQGVVMTLNSLGYPTNGPVWMLGGVPLKFIIKNAAGVTQSTFDNISGIGDVSTASDEWILYGAAPTYISATSFSVVGDQTNTFQVLRKLKSTNSGGTTYSTIATSAFAAGVTTVTVTNTSGTLDSGMSAVSYGLLSATNPSIPETPAGKKLRTNASGAVLNIVEATPYTTYTSSGTVGIYDDSKPQISEGTALMSVSITPTSATSRLRVEFYGYFGTNSGTTVTWCAMFRDSTADAVAAGAITIPVNTAMLPMGLEYEVAAGSTNATTFSIRFANTTATSYVNGIASGRLFGGAMACTMRVTEIAA